MADSMEETHIALNSANVDILSALLALQQRSGTDGGDKEEEETEPSIFEKPSLFEKDTFLEALRELPCLWNVNSPQYKDRGMKNNAWKQLSSMFNEEVVFLQKQLKNMKDVLKKCLDKRNRMTRSGAAAATLPKCQYFDQMAFLHEKSANKPTESNLSLVAAASDVFSDVLPTEECQFSQPSPSGSVSNLEKSMKTPQRKKKRTDSTEALTQSLADCDELLKKSLNEKNDEDALYCRSLVPIMRELPKKKNRLAKIKISQLLFDLQFNEDE